jgi:DNA primase
MSVIDDVKARIDIVELVSQTVKLRKSGRNFMGLCPFHAHKNNTPSFAVWPESGTWKCFGQCNEGGDIFKFVMKRDNVDFAEALRLLAQRAGVELKPRTPEEQAQDDNLNHLRQLLEAAVTYYHHLLKNAPQAAHAREHLAQRGLTDKAIEMFALGYALDAWEAAFDYFSGKGYSQQDLREAGLIVEKEDGKVFDRFRDRLMIPVRDERGRMTGFQARALTPEAQPKFMNSPQTALFDKGRTLFGLHQARKAIREVGAAIVVEGNLDVIAAHQAGFSNVVSSQGTALTEHQLRLLKKHAKRIVLALDADEAGDAATLRGLDVAREALDREADFTFNPHGLVKTEGRLGADIRVMTLPEGVDPDDVINRDPEAWRQLVEQARPVVEYVSDVLTGKDRPEKEKPNLDDPKVKTEIAEAVLPLIEDVAQPIERDTYRQKLARILRVDERALVVKRAAPRRRTPSPAVAPAVEPEPEPAEALAPDAPVSRLEAYCLGTLLKRPELLYKADRQLLDSGLPRLVPEEFLHTDHQLLFRAVVAALEQFESDPADYLRDHLEPALKPRMDTLVGEGEAETTNEARATEALLLAVLRLRRRTLKQWLNDLRFLAEDAREQGDVRGEAYQREITQQAAALARVDRALASKRARGVTALPRLHVR